MSLTILKEKNKIGVITTLVVLLSLAFVQCYKTAHDLSWTVEEDFDRDQSFVQGTLDGNFGKDPSYRNQYLWYNPLVFLIETVAVKITGLPVNIILSRGGIYLNLFAPLAFAFMTLYFFGSKKMLAALAAFLFFTTGNLWGWSSATYSPWLYPVSFMQFIFYLNLVWCYKAFSTQKLFWFFILGVSLGISFLGHTAPTMLIILIMIFIQGERMLITYKEKKYALLKKYFLQGLLTFVLFILTSFPFLLFVIGKYKLHMVNRITFEFTNHFFNWFNFHYLFIENLSITALIALIGFITFYKNFKNVLIRKIIFGWFFISILLFFYATAVPIMRLKYDICLPGFVPSFHFFFYLKAIEAVFFAFGFVTIFEKSFDLIFKLLNKNYSAKSLENISSKSFFVFIIAIVLCYYPVYAKRLDFTTQRKIAVAKANETDKVEVYTWIVKNISPDKVILCNQNLSLFPVLATGRKMVSTNPTFSNPYIDFKERETDRMNMLSYLKSGYPDSSKFLFNKYDVTVLLINNDSIPYYNNLKNQFESIIFQNKTYSLYTHSN